MITKDVRYSDLCAPLSIFEMNSSEDTKTLIKLVTGRESIPLEGSAGNGTDVDGTYEGEVDYYDLADGLGYTLSYDYREEGYMVGRLVRYTVQRNELYDGAFDVTRERLTKVLLDLARGTYGIAAQLVADKFAIKL